MGVRLNKVTRELNVGLNTIVDFLKEKGIEISTDPNAKLSEEEYALVAKEFSKDSEVKKELSRMESRNKRKKNIPAAQTSEDKEEKEEKTEEKDNFISVKDQVSIKNRIKIVGNIDLEPKETKEAAPEKPNENPLGKEDSTEKEIQHTYDSVSEENIDILKEIPESKAGKEADEKERVDISPEPESKIPETESLPDVTDTEDREKTTKNSETVDDVSTESEVFKIKQEPLSEVKVVGSIDLEALNQKTRPAKKTKQEKEKERREIREANKKNTKPNSSRQNKKSSTEDNISDGEEKDNRKKRKRIQRGEEKIHLGRELKGSSIKESKSREDFKSKKLKKRKRFEKAEISDEDVEKQIKDTLARLGSRGKSSSSKHRRDKRDAIQQKIKEEHELEEKTKTHLKLTEFVTVAELAAMMNIPVTDIISTCMALGLFVSINQRLDAETINIVAEEFGFSVEFVSIGVLEAIEEEKDTEENQTSRPPIVTVMGHVDHGKTSLLDYIRKTNVITGEAGGITQHIGAYNVKLNDGKTVTFLDTPGHEAFTAMRARGAQVTDVVIIIVAADDDVMPQTVEAINHASAAGVPIVFAINKIDKPTANPDKIKEALANMNYLVEDWGGKYQCQEISAKKGINVKELIEKVLLEAELLDLKANPDKKAVGSIVESSLDKGRGYVATVLVQNGTLHIGDVILSGQYFGNVKAMFNEKGEKLEKAGPSEPALILGLNGAPQAGEKFNVLSNEKDARLLANKREQLQREQGLRTQKHITLDEIGRRIAVGNFQELNIIVKGDVDGSIEALADSLIKLSTEEIQVNVIHKAVGQISESDVMLAAASNAIIVGFQVRPSLPARRLAEQEEIDIRLYSIIYTAIEEIKSAMEGMLSPEIKEEITGSAEVLDTFKITKVGTIAGCIVRDGKISRTSNVRVIRDGIVVYTGVLGSLKRFKDDAKEVVKGFECGLNIENYNDIKIGDMIEAFQNVEVKKNL